MTHSGQIPTRRNRHDWTSYERARTSTHRSFGHDGRPCQFAPLADPGLEDIEDLTILAGLADDDPVGGAADLAEGEGGEE